MTASMVRARSFAWWVTPVAATALAIVAAACQPPQNAHGPTISLRIHGSPGDATVVIDDETLGTLDFVGAHGVALPPGVHHVTVTAAGYLPWDKEVQAEPGQAPIRLDVALARVPD